MQIQEELTRIVSVENVSDDTEVLRPYSKDHSLGLPRMPNYLVKPKSAEEVQGVVKLANEYRIPIVPCSSGIHFNGNTIPSQGGIVMDLRRMNKILGISEKNRMVRIEPGVTWGQLQTELEKHNLMALNPLLPHPLESVLTSHLERKPMLIPKFEYADNLVTVEVVLPDGEVFRTGSACVPGFPDRSLAEGVHPGGPGNITWSWLLQGAQGTMGVVTWAQVKTAPRPKMDKAFFIPFERIEDAIQLVYRIQRRMIGEECLILNDLNLAAILARKWPEDFDSLRKTLSPWTVVLVLGGGWRHPEEKIEYEEEGLHEAAAELSVPELPTSVPGLPGLERELPGMLRTSWAEGKPYWKFAYKGACQDLFFHTTMNKTPTFVQAIGQVSAKHGYCIDDVGFYVQPLEYARACHFECNFYYNPDDPDAVERIRNLLAETAGTVLDMGAFFTRPYGLIADMVYDRATGYTMALKKVKQLLDPNNIMSPGRLCF